MTSTTTTPSVPTIGLPPNPRNTIFVVGFPRNINVNTNDFKFFFERHIPGAKVVSSVIHKGHSRRVPGQEEREPGTPFAFVIFESEASVQAAVNLNQRLTSIFPATTITSTDDQQGQQQVVNTFPSSHMFANIKIERLGIKNRIKNSLYVTGFRYSDSVQAGLKKFFEENLFDTEEEDRCEVEVDVYPVVMPPDNEHDENATTTDKSYAFVFFPDQDSTQLALATLNGLTVGQHGQLDLRIRSDEQKQRRKCHCTQQRQQRQQRHQGQQELPSFREDSITTTTTMNASSSSITDETSSLMSASVCSSLSISSKTQQQQEQQHYNKQKRTHNNNNNNNNKWSRTSFGSSSLISRLSHGCN